MTAFNPATEEFTPSTLPGVLHLEVVDLRQIEVNRHHEYTQIAKDAPSVSVLGETAQSIAQLFRELPAGEPYRCHIPPLGLRFFLASGGRCESQLCWQCNNISGVLNENFFWFTFDGEASISQELLKTLIRITGWEVTRG